MGVKTDSSRGPALNSAWDLRQQNKDSDLLGRLWTFECQWKHRNESQCFQFFFATFAIFTRTSPCFDTALPSFMYDISTLFLHYKRKHFIFANGRAFSASLQQGADNHFKSPWNNLPNLIPVIYQYKVPTAQCRRTYDYWRLFFPLIYILNQPTDQSRLNILAQKANFGQDTFT